MGCNSLLLSDQDEILIIPADMTPHSYAHVCYCFCQAKANRLSPSDLTGGTISLSNVGVISGGIPILVGSRGPGSFCFSLSPSARSSTMAGATRGRISVCRITNDLHLLLPHCVSSGTYIHPLLFDGQAVIVGVGRVRRLPRFVERETAEGVETALEARDMINCSFSADHRHCDGATVTRFSKR